jgi:hypothetical protein
MPGRGPPSPGGGGAPMLQSASLEGAVALACLLFIKGRTTGAVDATGSRALEGVSAPGPNGPGDAERVTNCRGW